MDFEEILNAKMPLQEKADRIFGPGDSQPKKIFINLRLRNGGLEPAVDLLGAQRQYETYQKDFNSAFEAGQTKKAVELLQKFRQKLITQLCLKFKI